MIKFSVTALIRSVSQVIEIPSKNGGQPFQKRELVLEDTWERNGERFSDIILIEFAGERMNLLNGYSPGQCVTVEVKVSGRIHDGRVFNTLRGLSIVPYQSRSQGVGQRPAAAPAQTQQPAQPQYPQPQQPQYPAPGGYSQQPSQGQYPQQGPYYQPQNTGSNDLPFR